MIQENKAVGGNPTPKKELTDKPSSFKDINFSDSSYSTNNSIESIERKICFFLLQNRGWNARHRIFDALGFDIREMDLAVRAVHHLGKHGIIDVKGNAIKANKKTAQCCRNMKAVPV